MHSFRYILPALVFVTVLPLTGNGAPVEKTGGTPTLTAERLDKVWTELIQLDDEGCKQAIEDMLMMMRSPDLVVPFLKDRLKPAPGINREQILQVIADLDSNDFTTREKATKHLEGVGVPALPLLEKKLEDKEISLEMQNRLRRLIQTAEGAEAKGLSADDLRTIRAIEVLSAIGSPDARAILDSLARGGESSVVTVSAQRALMNLKRRGLEK